MPLPESDKGLTTEPGRHETCTIFRKLLNAGTHRFYSAFHNANKEDAMLYTIAVILLVLWLLGLVTSYTIGGFIHILIVIAIVMVLIRLISGRAP